MAKQRIYELARSLGLPSTEVLACAQRLGFGVTTVLNCLEDEAAAAVTRSVLTEGDPWAGEAGEMADGTAAIAEAEHGFETWRTTSRVETQSDGQPIAWLSRGRPQRLRSLRSSATAWIARRVWSDAKVTIAAFDADRSYLARTVDRIRSMTAASADMKGQDAEEVRARLARMVYGGSKHRNRTNSSP